MLIDKTKHGYIVNMDGGKLKSARNALGMTQMELGGALGWTGKNRVYRLEAGRTPVRVVYLLALECLLRREGLWGTGRQWWRI